MSTADSEALFRAADFSLADAPLEGGGTVLTVSGELDVATAPALRERLHALADARPCRLVLDLQAVSFMDSTALAVFIGAKTRIGDDGRMALVIARDSYARLIVDVVGLAEVLDVVETLEDGVRRVAS